MGRRDARRPRGARRLLWAVPIVALVAAGGVVVAEPDARDQVESTVRGWVDDLRGVEEPDPGTDPAQVPPPDGLVLPDVEPPAAPALALGAREVSPAQVRRTLAGPLGQQVLGGRVSVAVAGLTGPAAYSSGGAAIPASTTKLVTAVAALHALEPGTTFATRVVLEGRDAVLVGGGDPFLERRPDADGEPDRADLATLARRTARALRERGLRSIRLGYDDGLFSGPAWNPTWPDTYRDDVVAPITALMVDDGRPADGPGRSLDPSYAAADSLAALLRQRGIRIVGVPREAAAPEGAQPVAQVESAPVGELVDRLLQVSDNETSEVLLRHIGLATGGAGSTKDGVAGVRAVLEELGVPVPRRLRDGSGLSRDNLIAPATLVGLLQVAAASEPSDPVRGLFPGLPVAGFSGSLTVRFDDAPQAAVGRVRAKTGTLRGVRSLAGVVVARDGTPMVFALMADRIPEADDETAEAVLDRAAAALAACRCGRAG